MTSADVESPKALPDKPSEVSWSLLLLGFIGAIGGFLFGYDTGSMGASLLQVKRPRIAGDLCPGLDTRSLTTHEQAMVTSFVVLGAFISAAGAARLNDQIGRKGTILVASTFFTAGALLMAFSMSLPMMLVARIVLGFGVGLASHSVPLYISECAPSSLRGSLCFLNDMMIVVGQVAAAAVSTFLFMAELPNGWRWILGAAVVPSLLMFVGIIFMPESPRWLLANGQQKEARRVLTSLRGASSEEALASEFDEMANGIIQETPRDSVGGLIGCYHTYWKDLRVRRALLLGCGLQCLQQWCGINTIMYYGASMLDMAEPGKADSDCFNRNSKTNVAYTTLLAASQLIGVFLSWICVDRLGRRPLVLASLLSAAFWLAVLGFIFSAGDVSRPAVVACVILYLFCFGVGLSPVPWTVNAEIYPLHSRASCISMSTSVNWLMNFVVSVTFLHLATSLSTYPGHEAKGHPNGVFWVYSAISVVGFVLLWRLMPETKGLALEHIGKLFTDPDDHQRLD
mmetsp:Transcript_76204/g.163460  ORF Transcript_76204/g.163460 Transcript_76204/m.163460 type:complete len:512 (-) Transcript_76204:16-1551(-)